MIQSILVCCLVTAPWPGHLGEQGTCFVAREVILVPAGTALRARRVSDGQPAWHYDFVERRGLLNVPCRIQGVQVFAVPPPRIPGIPMSPDTLRTAPDRVCLAGNAELHCLATKQGAVRWKVVKGDGCVLSLHDVGDVDRDGASDLVCCGCNLAECFSGRSGAVLWSYPVTGRSLWAGPAGDLDGDGLGEVLLQAGRRLQVITCPRPGAVAPLYPVGGFFPAASMAVKDGVLVAFGGASAWCWTPDGTGKREWQRTAHLLDAFATGARPVIATRDGLWVRTAAGVWQQRVRRTLKAVSCAERCLFFADAEDVVFAYEADTDDQRQILKSASPVAALAAGRNGRTLCVISGRAFSVHRVKVPAP